jgi:hypothetical protein
MCYNLVKNIYFDQKYEKTIEAGMRGVLVFGADNEAKARREAYNLLNEVIKLTCFFLVVL